MAKISVNTGEVKRNVRQISTAGNALAGKQDGLRQPNSSINTPTPKKIREKYTQIKSISWLSSRSRRHNMVLASLSE